MNIKAGNSLYNKITSLCDDPFLWDDPGFDVLWEKR